MTLYEKSLVILDELFGKDFIFSLATVNEDKPSIRVIDTYYEEGALWGVTYALSNKVMAIEKNPNVALCNMFYSFNGKAFNMGHPLKEENKAIREKLIKVFEPWYFAHNNEADAHMCYIKIELEAGFFHKDGRGYKINFLEQSVEDFPFEPQLVEIN